MVHDVDARLRVDRRHLRFGTSTYRETMSPTRSRRQTTEIWNRLDASLTLWKECRLLHTELRMKVLVESGQLVAPLEDAHKVAEITELHIT